MKKIVKLLLCLAFFTVSLTPAQELSESPQTVDTALLAEIRCLELNIHFEARGEPLAGQKAVANVTRNRALSGKFPDTICKVVKQPGQFSWVRPKFSYAWVKVDEKIHELAVHCMLSIEWRDNTKNALYFHHKSIDDNRKIVASIGEHNFFK